MTAISGLNYSDWQQDTQRWGRLVEVAVGAHLINTSLGKGIQLFYWRYHNKEVDFILQKSDKILAIEKKGGMFKGRHSGLFWFRKLYPQAKILLVGPEGIPVHEFLSYPASHWFYTIGLFRYLC